jgi:hypothetical protein
MIAGRGVAGRHVGGCTDDSYDGSCDPSLVYGSCSDLDRYGYHVTLCVPELWCSVGRQ